MEHLKTQQKQLAKTSVPQANFASGPRFRWRSVRIICHRRGMPRKTAEFAMGKDGRNAVRVTTTLTRQQHAELNRLADQNSVKIAWLVRRAVERLVDEANRGTLTLDFGLGERRSA